MTHSVSAPVAGSQECRRAAGRRNAPVPPPPAPPPACAPHAACCRWSPPRIRRSPFPPPRCAKFLAGAAASGGARWSGRQRRGADAPVVPNSAEGPKAPPLSPSMTPRRRQLRGGRKTAAKQQKRPRSAVTVIKYSNSPVHSSRPGRPCSPVPPEALHSLGERLCSRAMAMLDDEELQAIYTWVDEIPLSRPKRNISRDFSDGGPCATHPTGGPEPAAAPPSRHLATSDAPHHPSPRHPAGPPPPAQSWPPKSSTTTSHSSSSSTTTAPQMRCPARCTTGAR